MTETRTQYRVIARYPETNKEYVWMTTYTRHDFEEQFSWAATERYLGDFVRVETRTITTTKTSTAWEEMHDESV